MPRPQVNGLKAHAAAMGVPGLFGWLRRKYPEIVAPAPEKDPEPNGSGGPDLDATECDNLYIGELPMQIIHIQLYQASKALSGVRPNHLGPCCERWLPDGLA